MSCSQDRGKSSSSRVSDPHQGRQQALMQSVTSRHPLKVDVTTAAPPGLFNFLMQIYLKMVEWRTVS